MEAVAKLLDEICEAEAIFTVKKLKYGGFEVLVKPDNEYPSRHICDFRTEVEARLWIRENAHKHIEAFETRHEGMVTGMVDERCPENVTPRSAAFQLAARALSGENFRLYFEDYDVAHCYLDCEAVAG